MSSPQEQFTELTRRTQENFKHLWEQWSQRSSELLKGLGSRPRTGREAPGNPEEVLDAVFDFAENLIAQQRAFAKQMLRAASRGQQVGPATDGPTAQTTGAPTAEGQVRPPPPDTSAHAAAGPGRLGTDGTSLHSAQPGGHSRDARPLGRACPGL